METVPVSHFNFHGIEQGFHLLRWQTFVHMITSLLLSVSSFMAIDFNLGQDLHIVFLGQIFNLVYLRKKWYDCHKTENAHIDLILGIKCSHQFWPWAWPWPFLSHVFNEPDLTNSYWSDSRWRAIDSSNLKKYSLNFFWILQFWTWCCILVEIKALHFLFSNSINRLFRDFWECQT